jgi:beta-glucosidase
MTLDEKISQIMNAAPAIDRLGIPEYNWWNECLHGVARAGLATVFPQAIGLGATWDKDLMFEVSTAISDEARAKHHEFVRRGKRYIYQGLTFWSPNINIFRDPRWGRGQETYGEDPYLTGKLAVQFIKGLQGDDPKYFKTIATVKHYAVHSGPEPKRHSFDAQTDERDFRETYLPQFEMGIKEDHAYSVMCAYNRYEGDACCGSRRLLIDILRNEWNFDGYVVSDCGAIGDIWQHHKVVETPEEAAALAVKSGCDLECSTTYQNLGKAVKENLITEKEIDVAVKRVFTARFKLGMFDPPEMVKYTKIPYSIVDSKEHKELALKTAQESIVLLKNQNKLLPLKKEIGTVAVIGPNSDEWLMLLGNYNGIPSGPITPLHGIKEKLEGKAQVLYAQGSELADSIPMYSVIPPGVFYHGENLKGLNTDYYNNHEMRGEPLYSEIEKYINADWGDKSPRKDMDDDNFSVVWSGEIIPDQTGDYTLGFITTCNTNLYLSSDLIVNSSYHFKNEFGDPRLRKSAPIHLEAGRRHPIKLEASETYGDAQIRLVWTKFRLNQKEELKKEAIEIVKKSDVVIMCMGLTARLEGEEMDIEIDGFDRGDRTRLSLPEIQEELIKDIQALGKPVVLVSLNGSALAVNWEEKNIPAIIEAWYPGQAAGAAIADVIFGDYNPGGKLPVTFYKSVKDLPSFEQYNLTSQTYRYFKGEPLFPFGYGLSYTSFVYSNFNVKDQYKLGDTLHISIDVQNTGDIYGDEVVQLYISNLNPTVPSPILSLKGFDRIHLKAGETRTVNFSVPPDAFSFINEKNVRVILQGEFEISVGGGQPGSKGTIEGSNVLSKRIVIYQ